MDRKEFLSIVGLGAAAFAAQYCLGCKAADDQTITGPSNVDFTLDLTAPANAALASVGGYIYKNGIIVARTAGGYVAVSFTCTHQGGTVTYDNGAGNFYCPNHGSRFATSGAVVNGPADRPLTHYNTSLSGTSLRVYS